MSRIIIGMLVVGLCGGVIAEDKALLKKPVKKEMVKPISDDHKDIYISLGAIQQVAVRAELVAMRAQQQLIKTQEAIVSLSGLVNQATENHNRLVNMIKTLDQTQKKTLDAHYRAIVLTEQVLIRNFGEDEWTAMVKAIQDEIAEKARVKAEDEILSKIVEAKLVIAINKAKAEVVKEMKAESAKAAEAAEATREAVEAGKAETARIIAAGKAIDVAKIIEAAKAIEDAKAAKKAQQVQDDEDNSSD